MLFISVIINLFNRAPQKSRLTKWLLFGILSVGISSFPGFVANNYSGYSLGERTEFVAAPNSSAEGVIPFRQVVACLFHKQQHFIAADNLFNVCLYHNRLTSIRFHELSQERTTFGPFTSLLPVKTIPGHSNPDAFHITIG